MSDFVQDADHQVFGDLRAAAARLKAEDEREALRVEEQVARGVPLKRAQKVARREREIAARRGRTSLVEPKPPRPKAPASKPRSVRSTMSVLAAFAAMASVPTAPRRGRR